MGLIQTEIYYIAEVSEEDKSRLSISQTSSDDDQSDLYGLICGDDPLYNGVWTVKYQKGVDADKELERTSTNRN